MLRKRAQVAAADDLGGKNGRQVIVAGVLRTRRANPGGDLSAMGAKRAPNTRDGARCDAAFQKSPLSPSRFDPSTGY